MKRSEFLEEVTTFWELRDFCHDENISVTDGYIDGDELDQEVEEDVCNRDCCWDTLRDCLNDICYGSDFYYRNGWLDYIGQDDDDFEELKEKVLDIMDDRGDWDDEENDEDDSSEECEESETTVVPLDEVWFQPA